MKNKHFQIKREGNQLHITKKTNIAIVHVIIMANHHVLGQFPSIEQIEVELPSPYPQFVFIQGFFNENNRLTPFFEIHLLKTSDADEHKKPDVDYQAGDILVACDNANGLPYGYMGHAAIVVDDKHLIEAVPSSPIVRKMPITNFLNNHPKHAQYRPKSVDIAKGATEYVINYLNEFQKRKEKGEGEPKFFFTLLTPLEDEWTFIYCSKLIWLAYFHGAKYEFHHDWLWFSPEDLYSNLNDNDDFTQIYKHPNYEFKIDI